MITVYGIKNCDSVKKARKWLSQNDLEYGFHDVREDGLDAQTINQWLKTSDWNTLLNRRSTSWKKLSETQREAVSETNVVALLLENPTLIKRPVVTSKKNTMIGFSENEYAEHLLP